MESEKRLPKDWERLPIKKVVRKFLNGGTPSTKVSSYWTGSIPWVTGADFENQKVIIGRRYISEEAVKNSATNVIPKGQILMVTRTGVGKIALAPENIAISQDITGLVVDETRHLPRFVFWQLDNNVHRLKRTTQGTSINGLLREDLEIFRLPLPPKKEQERIVEIIDSINAAIEHSRTVIDQIRLVKTALLQDILTNGLPGKHKRFRKVKRLGNLPASWKIKKCDEICSVITVGVVIEPSKYYTSKGIPFLRSANVQEEGIVTEQMVFLSEISNQELSKSMLKTGDVIAVRSGYPGTCCVVPPEYNQANCVDLIIFRPSPDMVDSEYLALWINSEVGKGQVLRGQTGLAQQHFNIGEAKKMLVALPPIDEQKAISSLLKLQAERLQKNVHHLEQLTTLKMALSQGLLTGQIPVKV